MPGLRDSMAELISRVRLMINDPLQAGGPFQFDDLRIQNQLDANRDDIRYEGLALAPSIVNAASTNNVPETIFADYYSKYGWWEADVVLQAYHNGQPWKVVTPLLSELMLEQAHWQFELDVFNTGTIPGQLPPVFATGKVYDLNATAADLLEFWAATLVGKYDVVVDGQNLKRSQLMAAKLAMAQYYRRMAKPKVAHMHRSDVMSPISTRRMRLLDNDDIIKGA